MEVTPVPEPDTPLAADETTPAPAPAARWLAMAGVGLGVFMGTLDGSIVNIALPTLRTALKTDFGTVQWVVVSYLLVLTSLMLGAARLGDLMGRKRLYLWGLILFTVSSGLCGVAANVYALIGFRALQGVGSVLMAALGVAIVTEIFPPRERGKALGVIGGVVSLGIASGPTIGGLLLASAGWRSLFWVNLPIGLISYLIAAATLPEGTPPARKERFDAPGALLTMITLLLFALGMTVGQERGFGSAATLVPLALSAVGLAAFLAVERRAASPMMDLTLFRNPALGMNLGISFLVFVVVAGYAFLMPFYLEMVLGYATAKTGLLLAAVPVLMGVIAPFSGSLSDRLGPRPIILAGLALLAAGCLTMATLNQSSGVAGFLLRTALFGVGFGMFQSPSNSAVMGSVPRAQLGIASGLLSLSRTLGQVAGFPVMGVLFASGVRAHTSAAGDIAAAPPAALVAGLHAALIVGAVILGCTALAYGLHWRYEAARNPREPSPPPG